MRDGNRVFKFLAAAAVAVLGLAGAASAQTIDAVADAIRAVSGLTAEVNEQVVTVTGTATNNATLTLDIPADGMVIWQANLTGSISSGTLVNLTGTGIFEMLSGSITNTAGGTAIINSSTGALNIKGGTVTGTGDNGIAIRNPNQGVITISQDNPQVPTLITSANVSGTRGTIFLEGGPATTPRLIVKGGTVQNTHATAAASRAIYNLSTGEVRIEGGLVRAMAGLAIHCVQPSGTVRITGSGVVFAHGNSAEHGTDNTNNVVNRTGGDSRLVVEENGVIIARNAVLGNTFLKDSDEGLVSNPANSVKWDIDDTKSGIAYTVGDNVGFLEISGVTLVESFLEGMKDAIEAAQLTAIVNEDDKTVTVTGTRTGYNSTLELRIPSDWEVIWQAELTGNITNNLVNLTGTGTFEMVGGSITNTSSTTVRAVAINNSSTGALNIKGGTVAGTGNNGIAIRNQNTGVITISQDNPQVPTLITSTNLNDADGTILLQNSGTAQTERLIIRGGTVQNTQLTNAASRAIRNLSSGAVEIKGGWVRAAAGLAIYSSHTETIGGLTIEGNAVVFAHGTSAVHGTSNADNVINRVGFEGPRENAVIIAYQNETNKIYIDGSNDRLISNPAGAKWSLQDGKEGIAYGDDNFTELPGFVVITEESEIQRLAGHIRTIAGLSTIVEGNTVTVTSESTVTRNSQFDLEIPQVVAVVWKANITGNTGTTANASIINLTGLGTFNIASGSIAQTSTNGATSRAITNNSTGSLNVSGGTVSATVGIAVWNNAGGIITVSQTATITSASATTTQGTIHLADNASAKLNIEGGTVQNTATTSNARTVYNVGVAEVNVSGGTVSATLGRAIHNQGAGTVNVSGGTVSATTGQAIHNQAAGGTVNISGGLVRATDGHAFFAQGNLGILTVSGTAVLFANGTQINTNSSLGVISHTGFGTPTEGGVIIAHSSTASGTLQVIDATTGLLSLPANAAKWDRQEDKSGIAYTAGNNIGFFEIPTVSVLADIEYVVASIRTIASLSTTVEGNTITVTSESTVTRNSQFNLNIPRDITVVWKADITGSTSGAIINLTGLGTFNVSGGTVNAAAGTAISNQSTGTINVSVGTVSAATGNAISNQSTGTINVSGGTVSAGASGRAVHQSAGGTVNISGGLVRAANGHAFFAQGNLGTLTVSGTAVLFANGTQINASTTAGVIGHTGFGTPTEDGVIIAYDVASGTSKLIGTTTGLLSSPADVAKWDRQEDKSGISYTVNDNIGFFEIPTVSIVTVAELLAENIRTIAGLSTEVEGNTVTVTSESTVTRNSQFDLEIPQDVTVVWKADITGGTYSANASIINLTGTGTFNVVSGSIAQTSTGATSRAITNSSAGEVNVSGGTVSAVAARAIHNEVAEGKVNITGGMVRAASGHAFVAQSNLGTLTVSGTAVLFANGTQINSVANSIAGVISHTGFGAPTEGGVIIAYDAASGTSKLIGTTTGLLSLPANAAKWDRQEDKSGISYTVNDNIGFFEIPTVSIVTVAELLAENIRTIAGLSTEVEGNTVTVTSTSMVTRNTQFNLEIPQDVTVVWKADITGNINTSIINLTGTGTFNMESGSIVQTSTSSLSRAITNNSTGSLNVSGGTVSATAGRAIHNQVAGGTVNISGGLVRAADGHAFFAQSNLGTLTVSGTAVLFANGTQINTNSSLGVITRAGFTGPTGDAVIIARNTSTTTANIFSSSGLISQSQGEASVAWVIRNGEAGIEYLKSANRGYLAMTGITLNNPVVTTSDLVFNGEEQTAGIAHNNLYYTVSDGKGTNAKNYTAILSLVDKDNNVWVGGSSDDLELPWSIAIAQQTISTNLVVTEDITMLSHIELPYGWTWDNPDVAIGDGIHKASFTCLDGNFEPLSGVEFKISVLFASGKGTEIAPWIIETASHLNNVRDVMDGHFKLGGNIYLEGSWKPIGTNDWVWCDDADDYIWDAFVGTFDGAGYYISGVSINADEDDYDIGFFVVIGETAVIKNLGLVDISVKGGGNLGGLVGQNYGGTIENCYVSGSVEGKKGYVGGLVGFNEGTINNSYSTANVKAKNYAGGLVGWNGNGWQYDEDLDDWVEVFGTISNSYATGVVEIEGCENGGDDYAGGLVGGNSGGTITNSYSIGKVFGSGDYVGGLVGRDNNGDITNSFYNSETSEQNDTGKGTPKTTEEMQLAATFDSWNFDNIWRINEENDYPRLGAITLSLPSVYFVYNGSEQKYSPASVTVTRTLGDDVSELESYKAEYANNINAGTNTASVVFEGTDGAQSFAIARQFSIGKAAGSGIVSINGWTFGETPSEPETEGATGIVLGYEYTVKGEDDYSDEVPTNAGEYMVRVNIAEGINHLEALAASTADFTILKAAGTWVAVEAIAATYTAELTLSDLTLPTGYTWVAPTTALTAGNNQQFDATLAGDANHQNATGKITVNVAKAAGTWIAVEAIAATYTAELTLSDLTLPTGYTWVAPTTALTAGNSQQFDAILAGDANHEDATGKITVNVAAATFIFANPENPKIGAIGVQTYYTLKGTPLGTQKPTTPGVYLEKRGKHIRKITIH